jgi:hypothetical protein
MQQHRWGQVTRQAAPYKLQWRLLLLLFFFLFFVLLFLMWFLFPVIVARHFV